jgi:CubicO group peptidase (beta-lactamase class C family)
MKFVAPLLASTVAMASATDFGFNATAVFDEVRETLDNSVISDMAFSMGDSRGEIFRYEKGSTTMETRMAIASATKWVSGVTVMAVVETGVLGLDDLASDHLDYWTTDPADNRSRITLRHLLSFVAGITGSTSCPSQLNFAECVENMYANSRAGTEPGEAMAYNEVALMYAGAMASAASGTPMEDLFEQYIFGPLDMKDTTWNDPNGRPLMGSGLTTNAVDYGKFLNAYFNGEIVSQETRAVMEISSYPNAALTGVASLQGQYGLANWFQCIPALNGMREQCIIDDIHMSVGARGYSPSTDRRHDFWMQIATSAGAATASGLQLVVHPVAVKAVLDSRE